MRAWSTRTVPAAAPPSPAGGYPYGLLAAVSGVMVALVAVSHFAGLGLSPLTWYLARASGITLYLLLWASMMLGIGLTTKFLDKRLSRAVVFSLHGYVTALSYAFLALHVLSLVADQYESFSLADVLIPFHASAREPWTGLGVIAAWLLLLIAFSSSLRTLTGYRAWRLTHWVSFPLYAMALAHSVGGGTDGFVRPVFMMYLGTTALFVVVFAIRIVNGRRIAALPIARRAPLDRMSLRG